MELTRLIKLKLRSPKNASSRILTKLDTNLRGAHELLLEAKKEQHLYGPMDFLTHRVLDIHLTNPSYYLRLFKIICQYTDTSFFQAFTLEPGNIEPTKVFLIVGSLRNMQLSLHYLRYVCSMCDLYVEHKQRRTQRGTASLYQKAFLVYTKKLMKSLLEEYKDEFELYPARLLYKNKLKDYKFIKIRT